MECLDGTPLPFRMPPEICLENVKIKRAARHREMLLKECYA